MAMASWDMEIRSIGVSSNRFQTAKLEPDTERLGKLQALLSQCETYASAENQLDDELRQLLAQQPLRTLKACEMDLV